MKIQVLGSGCPTCKRLHEVVQRVVQDEKINAEIEYVTGTAGMQRIIELNQMSSPVLVVDDRVVMVGFTPDVNKIKQKILGSVEN